MIVSLVLLCGSYLMLISTVTVVEAAVAVAASAGAGLATSGMRTGRRRFDPRWWLWPGAAAAAIPSDLAAVAAAIVRSSTGAGGAGSMRALRLPDEDGARLRARRTWAMVLISCTPGTYVIDVQDDGRSLLVHSLRNRAGRLERLAMR